jgi:hypothetical protein
MKKLVQMRRNRKKNLNEEVVSFFAKEHAYEALAPSYDFLLECFNEEPV